MSTTPDAAAGATLTRDHVAHLGHLARLELSDAELDTIGQQLEVILHSVARVSEIATNEVVPTTHAVPLTNVFRPDEVKPGLSHAAALAAAPATEDGRFLVPQILDDEQ